MTQNGDPETISTEREIAVADRRQKAAAASHIRRPDEEKDRAAPAAGLSDKDEDSTSR